MNKNNNKNNNFAAVSLLLQFLTVNSVSQIQPWIPSILAPTSCRTLMTVSHLTCPIPFDRTQLQLTWKHSVTYLGNSQHTYIGAWGGGTISRSQESGNDAADTFSEDSPVNMNKMVKYLYCKTRRKMQNHFPSYLLMACTGGVVAPDRRAQA